MSQVFDTPNDHVTRDYREGLAQLGDLQFRVIDTSGLEPAAPPRSLQVSHSVTPQLPQQHKPLTAQRLPQQQILVV